MPPPARADLPHPVRRYLERVLPAPPRPITLARMTQQGTVRTDLHRERWMRFTATHTIRPLARSFCWDARVRALPLVHLRVRDEYASGVGSGRVQLLSAITVAADRDKPELNAASLHRYLAEAVWCPTALLPEAGVQWTPIDQRSALATLSDAGNTVSLEFRFNEADEVSGVFAAGRWSRVGKAFVLMPWEGRFGGYRRCGGVLVPSHGEVGWYVDRRLEVVWKGEVGAVEYEFDGKGLGQAL